MNPSNEMSVVKAGSFLHSGHRVCRVRIVLTDFRPGSGDVEDEPEIQNDLHGEFFHVQYTPVNEERFSVGGGYFGSLVEAIEAVNKSVSGLEWD